MPRPAGIQAPRAVLVQVVRAWQPVSEPVPSAYLQGVWRVESTAHPRIAVLGLQNHLCRVDLRAGSQARAQQLWHCQPGQHLSALATPDAHTLSVAAGSAGSTITEHLMAAAVATSIGAPGDAQGSSVLLFDMRRPHAPVATWHVPLLHERQQHEPFTLVKWLPLASSERSSQSQHTSGTGEHEWRGAVLAASSSNGSAVSCNYTVKVRYAGGAGA